MHNVRCSPPMRADMVVFTVDCTDHDSMNTLKWICERHRIDYHPLRTASVASFVELTARLHPTIALNSATRHRRRFACGTAEREAR
ncbi:hypothetical protein LMG27177_03516 [Paraburkholderia fynbosensis]|uniref:Uncharacterized protein n=1 Tax=Paraburkholderia fynbosensis TaxID=1200993 RepID=A0A6J5G6D2_9BURK|nr:hypothetical protein LMG27177_03516 [Paraburkholderia fynbosensis]